MHLGRARSALSEVMDPTSAHCGIPASAGAQDLSFSGGTHGIGKSIGAEQTPLVVEGRAFGLRCFSGANEALVSKDSDDRDLNGQVEHDAIFSRGLAGLNLFSPKEHSIEPVRKTRNTRLPSYDGSLGSLQAQLSAAVIHNSPDGHKTFIPQGRLKHIVSQKGVQAELSRCKRFLRKHDHKWKPTPPHKICGEDENVLSTIGIGPRRASTLPLNRSRSYRKIFAILALTERPFDIGAFVEEHVCDADLPLEKRVRSRGSPRSFELWRTNIISEPLLCFEGWKDGALTELEQYQWMMLAPSFTQLNAEVEIQPEHHLLHTFEEPNNVFAVKELLSKEQNYTRNKEGFRREAETLRRLSRPEHAHDHLITLLATYEQHDRYFLVLPWAEADLLGYWKNINPNPSRDKSTALWLAKQCQGLADALSRIHRYETLSGTSLLHPSSFARRDSMELNTQVRCNPRRLFRRHGDIKLDNILWFPGRDGGHGMLKLMDFGTAHFSTRDSVSAEDREEIPNSATYQPPEWALPHPMLKSSYDIWTLGCVYLEFITWYVGGCEYLTEFGQRRQSADYRWREFPEIQTDTFFTVEKGKLGALKAKVKNSVIQFIDELRSHSVCSKFFREFLTIIQNDQLMVERSGKGRKASANLARELYDMAATCERDAMYVS